MDVAVPYLEECNIQDRTQKMIYIFSTLNCSPSDSSSARRWMVKLPHWVELAWDLPLSTWR